MILGAVFLFIIFVAYKLFVDGWAYYFILFVGGWFGLYIACRLWLPNATKIAIAFNWGEHPITMTWAILVPSIVCFLGLLCKKE